MNTLNVHPAQTKPPQGLGFWNLIDTGLTFYIDEYNKGDEANYLNKMNLIDITDVQEDSIRNIDTKEMLLNDIERVKSLYNNKKASLIWIGGSLLALTIVLSIKSKQNGRV